MSERCRRLSRPTDAMVQVIQNDLTGHIADILAKRAGRCILRRRAVIVGSRRMKRSRNQEVLVDESKGIREE